MGWGLSYFRKTFVQRMMRPAIAERTIHFIKIFRKRYINHPFRFLDFLPFSAKNDCIFRLNEEDDWLFLPCPSMEMITISDESKRKRGVIYARVSREEQQKKGFSLQSQVRILRELMGRDNVEKAHPPIEEAESGRGFDRRGVEELIKLAEGEYIDYVYIYRLDRLGRNVAETPFFMYKLNELGVTIRTPEREYRLDNPMDFLWAVFESCQSDMESRNIGERTQRGKVEKFKQKKWVGPVPFGYKKAGDWLEKVPELERVVREIFQTYIELRDVKATTDRINKRFDYL